MGRCSYHGPSRRRSPAMEAAPEKSKSSDNRAAVPSPSSSSLSADHIRATDHPFSILLLEMSQEAQAGLENMLKIITQVEHSASEIDEDIERCKESASERKMNLEIEKSRFQEAAKAVLSLLED